MSTAKKLTDREREAIATTRALAAAIAPSLLDAENGDVARRLALIAVELNTAALKAAGTPA